MPIIRVALDVPLSTLFDYFVSADNKLEIGQRIVVPFGRKQVLGVAMEWVEIVRTFFGTHQTRDTRAG